MYYLCKIGKRKSFSIQFNLRSQQNKLTDLPAVAQVIGSEPIAVKEEPAGAEKCGLPPTDRNLQKATVNLEEGNRKEEPGLLSVTGDLGGGRQAIGG